jgi:uncharacterized protein with FMN-binding domain
MKKLILSAVTVIAFIFYAVFQRGGHLTQGLAQGTPSPATGSTQPAGVGTSSGSQPAGTLKDGTYTGDPADAFFGTVQVQAVIKSGRVNSVRFLNYPQDRQRSMQINSQAVPLLQQEAVQAQSASVQVVTGATLTSQAFMQSLQSALTKAGG